MDLLQAKSRIAEALVASVFGRERYQVSRFQSDQFPLRFGREDFSPDLRVLKPDDGNPCEFLVEVRYRPHIEQFIAMENQRRDQSVFRMARRHWPQLYVVLVTDRPGPGRSCFQVIAFDTSTLGDRFRTVDLADLKELGIAPHNVEDHEDLVRRIFGLLTAA